jgi:hypothetical protein
VPVNITLVKDPVYNASHGLTYTTDFSYNRSTSRLTCVTRQAGRDFYSAMIDAFIAQSSLDNTPFPLTAVGIDSIFFNDDAELLDATSEDNWFDAGIRYINSSGTTTAEWCSIKSSGSIPAGVTGRYQTGAGTGTTALRTTGAVNQIIQIYGDATHGNFDHRSYLVIKFQANPYVDTRSNILALAGVSTLEPFEYSVAIEPTALNITAGDSGAALTLVDHTAAPITVGGKSFSYEIQDGGTNSAEAILRAWDYNIAQTGTYQGTDTFNLPEFIAQSGSTYETRRGIVETKGSTLYGCYVSRGGSDHPDFAQFRSDDGTYYTPAQSATATISNITTTSRVQLYDTANAVELYNGVPGSTSYQFSETYSIDRTIRVRITDVVGANAKKMIEATVGSISVGNYNISYIANQENDTTYNDNAIDGSTVTGITIDDTTDLVNINIALGSTTWPRIYAYQVYWLNTETGIRDDFAFIDAPDTANYILTSFRIKNTSSPSVPLTISGGYGRDSSTGASVDLVDTSGGTLIFAPDHVIAFSYDSGSGGFTTADRAALQAAATEATATAIKTKTDNLSFTVSGQIDSNIQYVNDTPVGGTGVEGDEWGPI